MYTVIKRESKELINLFSSDTLDEARRYLETYTYDFVVSKVGEGCLEPSKYDTNVVTYLANSTVKGKIDRVTPICLHRKYSIGSRKWSSIKFDYFIIRDIKKSIFGMSVNKKNKNGWWSCEFDEIFSIDITKNKYIYKEKGTPWCENCEELRYQYRNFTKEEKATIIESYEDLSDIKSSLYCKYHYDIYILKTQMLLELLETAKDIENDLNL